jgi:acetylornithine deacetylase
MKGGVVGMLAAAGALKECEIQLEGDLGMLFTADEEGGCAYGAKFISEKGIEADAIILGEPSGENKDFDSIGLASRGVLLGKIILHGTQMHSSISDRGGCVNASVKMAKVLLEFADNLKKYLRFKPHKLYPLGPTINPGVTLEGGVFYGVIPGQAGFGFDLRVIPGMEFDVLEADIKRFLKDLKEKDRDIDAELVLEKPPLDAWIPPAEIDEKHPVVKDCISSAEKVLGYKPRKVGEPFGTEASFYVNELGIPTIPSFGPGYIKLAHGPDEYVETKAIIDAAKIYALIALKFLKIQ